MPAKLGKFLLAVAIVLPQATPHASAQNERAASLQNAQEHLGAGLKMFQVERYAEASKEFRLALESSPDLPEARYYLAVSCFNERNYAEARGHFEGLLHSGYQREWVTYYLGRLDLQQGRLDSAVRRFASLKLAEPLTDELYYLGSALMRRGDTAGARDVLERQIRFNPRDFRAHSLLARVYMKSGNRRKAEEEFEKSDALHEYYLKGKGELASCRNDLASGNADQAWTRCGSALKTDDIDKLVSVGTLFGEFRSYGHAVQTFQKALNLDPESPEINYNLGFTYFQQGQYGEARKFLETALHLRPDFFEALAIEGTILYALHQDSAARRVLDRAHALRPHDEAVTRLLTQIPERGHQ